MALNIKIKEAPKTAKKEYPVLKGDWGFEVDEMVMLNEKGESLIAQSKAIEAELKDQAIAQFFEQYHGKTDIPSSMKIEGIEKKAMISFTSRYKEVPVDDAETKAQVDALAGADAVQEKFLIKIDGDLVPVGIQQSLCDELVELFSKHDCVDALSVKQTYTVRKAFHHERHTALTPSKNRKFNELVPMVMSVKKKGVL